MELLYKYMHLSCCNYDKSERPIIEVINLSKRDAQGREVNTHEVVFVMKGEVRLGFKRSVSYTIARGQMVLIPVGTTFVCTAMTSSQLVVFRMHTLKSLCDNISLSKLYDKKSESFSSPDKYRTKQMGSLNIHPRIWYFLVGIVDAASDGLHCRNWFNMKVQEFFLLLNAYYQKELIYEFLFLMQNKSNEFVDYIQANWAKYPNVADLASSMHLTPKYFSSYFVSIFGKLPSRWIREQRAREIHREIVSTSKPFRQIALEQGFVADALFTRFCKAELGNTPTEIRRGKTGDGLECKEDALMGKDIRETKDNPSE